MLANFYMIRTNWKASPNQLNFKEPLNKILIDSKPNTTHEDLKDLLLNQPPKILTNKLHTKRTMPSLSLRKKYLKKETNSVRKKHRIPLPTTPLESNRKNLLLNVRPRDLDVLSHHIPKKKKISPKLTLKVQKSLIDTSLDTKELFVSFSNLEDAANKEIVFSFINIPIKETLIFQEWKILPFKIQVNL